MNFENSIARKRFALVDCNNFYVSCERLFRPDLEQKPVVVLSGNDGCVVARSNEVKQLGVKMGIPLFKIKALVHQHKIITLSSNFALYGDLSERVMSILSTLSPHQEVYSIDESFLDFTDIKDSVVHGQLVRQTIKQSLGLPVCVGIAPTKTLAKLSNFVAKHNSQYCGVFDITKLSTIQQEKLLAEIPVKEVWGIGRKLSLRLHDNGFRSVKDLRDADPERMGKQFSVVVKRIVFELRGISCLALDDVVQARKQIVCSRSFGQYAHTLKVLEEAIATYAARAAEKLRSDSSLVTTVQVFLQTNRFSNFESEYHRDAAMRLDRPTNDTIAITKTALLLLRDLYQSDLAYKKAGIVLSDLIPAESQQLQLFQKEEKDAKSQRLMQLLDTTNAVMGQKTLYLAAEGHKNESWHSKSNNRTPAYTTSWNSLPIARA